MATIASRRPLPAPRPLLPGEDAPTAADAAAALSGDVQEAVADLVFGLQTLGMAPDLAPAVRCAAEEVHATAALLESLAARLSAAC